MRRWRRFDLASPPPERALNRSFKSAAKSARDHYSLKHSELLNLSEKGDFLFSYFEYCGEDFKADMKRMAVDPTTQEWWAVCTPCLEPVPDKSHNTWRDEMTEVFHLD